MKPSLFGPNYQFDSDYFLDNTLMTVPPPKPHTSRTHEILQTGHQYNHQKCQPAYTCFSDYIFMQHDTGVRTVSNNMSKIPSPIHTITRPSPAHLFVGKNVSHKFGQNDFLEFGIAIMDIELVEFDAFKPRESDLDVSTDVTDVFHSRGVAMSAIRCSLSLRLDDQYWTLGVINLLVRTKKSHRSAKKATYLPIITIIS